MTANMAARKLGIEQICCPCPDEEIAGVYIGDLLSWVMGRAKAGDVWVTIMSNINIVAVASLVGTACVILAEGVELDEKSAEAANARGVNVFRTKMTAYETAVKLSEIIKA